MSKEESPVDFVEGKLPVKQELFLRYYFGEAAGNASKAAELAGYGGNRQTVQAIGFQLLRKPQIRAAVAAYSEKHITPKEVIEKFASMASASMEDFISFKENGNDGKDNGKAYIDLKKAQKRGKLKAIKKIKIKRDKNGSEEIDIELYDAQYALTQLGKHFGLFDKDEVRKEQLLYLLRMLDDDTRSRIGTALGVFDRLRTSAPAITDGETIESEILEEDQISGTVLE